MMNYSFDTSGMSRSQMEDLAIEMLYDFAGREELYQGGSWSGSATSGAIEDIPSDMVGALVGQEMARAGFVMPLKSDWPTDRKRLATLDERKNAAYNEALASILRRCGPVSKSEAQRAFDHNRALFQSGKNWSAIPQQCIKNDPCLKDYLPDPLMGRFWDTTRFPQGKPSSVQPPGGKVWGKPATTPISLGPIDWSNVLT